MRRVILFIGKAVFILLFASIGLLVPQKLNPPQQVLAQTTCTTPAQVQNVQITFPYCDSSGQCNFTQAGCTWDALAGVSNYQITVTNATTNTQVMTQQVSSSTTSQVFNVQDNNTYTCSVAGINSCGTSGAAGTVSLLCKVDALVNTPTVAPTTPVVPTTPPAPAPTGVFENTILIGMATAALLLGGLFLIFI